MPSADDGRDAPLRPAGGARSLLGAASLVMLFFVLSRVTGVARDIAIASAFNLSPTLDAYQAAFRVPDLIFEVVAGGALGSAFIPTFSRLSHRRGAAVAWRLFSQTVNAVTLVLGVLALAGIAMAPWLMRHVLAPGFEPAQQDLAAELMRWLLLGTVVYGVSGLCMGALNTRRHFLLPAAAPALRNVAIWGAALWLAEPFGVRGLVVGAVAGSLLHLLIQLPALREHGLRYSWTLDWRDADLFHILKLMGPRMIGLLFIHLNLIVNTNLVSRLAPGSVSAFDYGFRLMLIPVSVFAQALSIVAFPSFAGQADRGRFDDMAASFRTMLRLVVWLAVPATVGMYLLRVPLIELLFERGSFDADSTQRVARALQYFLPGLTAYAAVEITVRAFYALHDTRRPMLAGVTIVLINIGLSLWWVGPLGYAGPALAASVATTVEILLLLWWLRAHLPRLAPAQLAWDSVRTAVASAAMGGAVWLVLAGIGSGAGPWAEAAWIQLLLGIAAGGTAYFLFSSVLGNVRWLAGVRRASV